MSELLVVAVRTSLRQVQDHFGPVTASLDFNNDVDLCGFSVKEMVDSFEMILDMRAAAPA
jgi:hypothetical protein